MSVANTGEPLLGLERNRPLHFAGRAHELRVLDDYLAYVRRTGDPTGGMILIDGVQGIGKTQLVAEFVRRAKAADADVLHVPLVTTDISLDAKALFAMLTRELRGSAARLVEALGRVREVGLGIAKVGINAEAPQTLGSLLAASARTGRWRNQALIVTVDEVQGIGRRERRMLKVLHEGMHGCPIMLVGAGLQHSREALSRTYALANGELDDSTISRCATRLTLGNLSEAEAVEAMTKGVAAAGLGELPIEAARTLAAASMGFPHHVHGYVAGALDALRTHGALDTEDALRQALETGDANRTQFYESRLTAMAMPDAMHHLAAAMDEEQEDRSLSRTDATAVLKAHLPPEVDATEVLRSAIEKGVLTTAPDGYVSFGIPSFHDYMMEQHHRVLEREARRARARRQRASARHLHRQIPSVFPAPVHGGDNAL